MKRRLTILLCSIVSVCSTLAVSIYTVVKQAQIPQDKGSVVTTPVTLPGAGEDFGSVSLINKETISVYVGDEITNAVLVNNKDKVLAETDLLIFDDVKKCFIAQKTGSAVVSIQLATEIRQITIQVFSLGSGTQQDPYNILNADKLIDLVASPVNNMSSVYYVQQCDLDLSGYASWKPIGDMSKAFLANYDGNGYSINNMNIIVTNANLNDYVIVRQGSNGSSLNTVTLGFFGRVGDSNNSVEIKNLSFNNASIDTTAVDGLDTLDVSYIGILAGQVRYSTVEGVSNGERSSVSAKINSALTINDTNYPDGVIAGLIGCTEDSEVSGYDVDVEFKSSSYGFVSGSTYYGSNYAGLVGLMFDTTLKDCSVKMSWEGQNYVETIVDGIACFVYDNTARTLASPTISNIEVDEFDVVMSRFTNAQTVAARVSGGFDFISQKSLVNKVNVNNIKISGIGTTQASGMVAVNEGTIQDSTVDGQILASISAGYVYRNNGEIKFASSISTPVVSATIYGQTYVGGFAVYNYGKITSTSQSEVVTALYWSAVDKYFLLAGESIENKYMIAGFAVVSAGQNSEISGFKVQTNIYDAINASGAVGYFGSHTYTTNGVTTTMVGGKIDNCTFSTTIRTAKGIMSGNNATKNYQGKANVFAGVVAYVPARSSGSATLSNIVSAITVNNVEKTGNHKTNVYGMNVFGGVVGVARANVTIDKLTSVYSKVYCSYAENKAVVGSIVGQASASATISVSNSNIDADFFFRSGVQYEESTATITKTKVTGTTEIKNF